MWQVSVCVSSMISHQPLQGVSIPFGLRLAASSTFDALFRDGMALVEETAAYLDGPGRDQSRGLPRVGALSYASESMRLTTRLMQIASWLLLQRAVNDGEMSQEDASADARRSRSGWHCTPPDAQATTSLPAALNALIDKSLDLQGRIMRLDAIICAPEQPAPDAHPLESPFAKLRAAFPG